MSSPYIIESATTIRGVLALPLLTGQRFLKTDISSNVTAGTIESTDIAGAAASPSASVGLSAVNGSSNFYMRADAAPALSQSISPTWTGIHTFQDSYSGAYRPISMVNSNRSSGVSNTVGVVLTLYDNSASSNSFHIICERNSDWTSSSNMNMKTRFLNGVGSSSPLAMTLLLGNVIIGAQSAISTSAADGFLHIPTCAGSMTGGPNTYGLTVPIIYDTTNNKLWAYNGGWKSVTLS